MNPNLPNPVSPDRADSADEASFADILSQFEQDQSKQESDPGSPALAGTVISVSEEAVLVDVGRKREGVLPLEQGAKLKAGDAVRVTITGRDENGYYLLSTVKVVVPKDWSGLQKAFDEKAVVTGTVEEVIKGGLRVDVGVRAFLPASRSGAREMADMEKLVGQQIACRITKLDTEKEDVVVDRRVVLEERAAKAKEEAFGSLQEGAVVSGTVRTVTEFGAFVEITPGVEGLLHVSEMSWSRGAKPEEIVKSGDQITVKILKVNAATRKISLGMKQLQADPWTVAVEKFQTGDRVRGKVTRVADFGAFVEIAPGLEGLIHVSEMSWSRKQKRAADIVKPEEMVEAVVLGINAAEKRIALGLKQTLGDPWEEAVKKYPAGTVVEAPVTSLQSFGAFVELGEGMEGMIHIGDITSEKRLDHPKEAVAVGKRVRAVVLELDEQRRRIRLGMKQLEPTSVDEYIEEHKVGDEVSGRVREIGKDKAKVELGEGVTASCRLGSAAAASEGQGERPAADLSSLTAMLEAKWKKGQQGGGGQEPLKTGQIRRFRIVSLDASGKRIELELAG
ncbi:MAG: S1 RNA-binding domain-containing protein [Acidimicrobiia bacterium]|nr:S1 RNA-binding domain-containing protein [Acidimicrobiia bacterium]